MLNTKRTFNKPELNDPANILLAVSDNMDKIETSFDDKNSVGGIATGTNTYTLTVHGLSLLTAGTSFIMSFDNTNTSTSTTVNVVGFGDVSLGAFQLKKKGGTNIAVGELPADTPLAVIFDGTRLVVSIPTANSTIVEDTLNNSDGTTVQRVLEDFDRVFDTLGTDYVRYDRLDDNTTSSGAKLVGVYQNELSNSASTNVQDVLDDLDQAINNITDGTKNMSQIRIDGYYINIV